MKTIPEIRQALASAVDEMKAASGRITEAKAAAKKASEADKDKAAAAVTEAEKAYAEAKELVGDLTEELERAEEAEKVAMRLAKPFAMHAGPTAPAAPAEKKAPGTDFARITRALIAAKGNAFLAAQWAEQQAWDNKDEIAKALGMSSATGGGYLVPVQYSSEIIELLRAKAVIFKAGPRILPMQGTLEIPRITAGVSGSYIGENTDATKEQPAYGMLKLTSKKLASIVPISNDLIRNSNPQADAVVRDDIVAGLAVTADAALIRDQGDGAAPKGLRYWAASGNVGASAGTSADNIETDLAALEGGLQDNNVAMVRPVWLMAPRSRRHLYKLRDANGNLIYPELRQTDANAPEGRIGSYPVFTTTNIPTNLGGGANETEVYLVDMNDVIVGEEMGIELYASDVATYVEAGATVSAFSRDQTVIRAIMKHDMVVRHAESVAVRTGVTWGA